MGRHLKRWEKAYIRKALALRKKLTYKAIAARLGINVRTVESYRE